MSTEQAGRRRSMWRTFLLLSGWAAPSDGEHRWLALVASRSPSPTSGIRFILLVTAGIAVVRSVGVSLTWGYLGVAAAAVWFAVASGEYAGNAAPLSGDRADRARCAHRDRISTAALLVAALWLVTLGLQRVAAR